MKLPFGRNANEPLEPRDTEHSGYPVVDRVGTAFDAMRGSDLGVGMYRVGSGDEVRQLDRDAVVLLATYDAHELEAAAAAIASRPTVVVGIGLSEHHGSRALSLGALGFVHDGLPASAVKERFSDALARHRFRQLRATRALA